MKKITIYVPEDFGWENRTNLLSIVTGISKNEAAKAIGSTPGSFLGRCRNGKFNLEERRKIAGAFNGKLVMKIISDDEKIFNADNYDNVKDLISDVRDYKKMSWADIAKNCGSYYEAFIQRLNVGKISDETITEIAEVLGCTYESYIELENGSVI